MLQSNALDRSPPLFFPPFPHDSAKCENPSGQIISSCFFILLEDFYTNQQQKGTVDHSGVLGYEICDV